MQLKEDFPSLKVVMLEQNYRSTSRIQVRERPHRQQPARIRALWSEMGHGDPIRVIRCRNEDAEAERIAMEILTPAPAHRAAVQRVRHPLPWQPPGQADGAEAPAPPDSLSALWRHFFGRQEVKDLMSYFRLLVNPDDDNAFLRVINVPRREIGSATLEKLGNYATQRKISMYAACDEMGLAEHLDSRFHERLQRFKRWMDGIRRRRGERRSPCCAAVMDIDYENWLRQNASSDKVAEFRMSNVWFLIEALKNTLERDEEGDMTIEQAIAKLVLRHAGAPAGRRRRRRRADDDPARVEGAGVPYVFIMGMEEEILPHRSSIEADTVEEERRLAYVGITRARQEPG